LNSCLGIANTGSGKYYPDWEGSNEKCIQDEPNSLAPGWIHYGYNMNQCMGQAATESNKYYVDWTTFKCVKDGSTGADC
jgi:hypothetical protein